MLLAAGCSTQLHFYSCCISLKNWHVSIKTATDRNDTYPKPPVFCYFFPLKSKFIHVCQPHNWVIMWFGSILWPINFLPLSCPQSMIDTLSSQALILSMSHHLQTSSWMSCSRSCMLDVLSAGWIHCVWRNIVQSAHQDTKLQIFTKNLVQCLLPTKGPCSS